VISIRGDKEVSIKYGASAQLASQIAANMDFSLTAPPQKKPHIMINSSAIDFKSPSVANVNNAESLSVKESLMNTQNNPMITPNSINHLGGGGSGVKRITTE